MDQDLQVATTLLTSAYVQILRDFKQMSVITLWNILSRGEKMFVLHYTHQALNLFCWSLFYLEYTRVRINQTGHLSHWFKCWKSWWGKNTFSQLTSENLPQVSVVCHNNITEVVLRRSCSQVNHVRQRVRILAPAVCTTSKKMSCYKTFWSD